MYILRDYQKQCVEKMLWSVRQPAFQGGDLVVLPTGAGKSLVIADFAYKLQKPVLVLQPSKEILEQNYAKMCHYVDPETIGIYSASMDRKNFGFVTFATIQSIYKNPEPFRIFKVVIIDEAHLVNPKNLDGMFMTFLNQIGNPRVFGLTATPYRLDTMYERTETGELYTHTTTKLINRLKERFWYRILFNINIGELIMQDILVPLKYMDKSVIDHVNIPTNISKSDFDIDGFEEAIADKEDEILTAVFLGMECSKSVLVFCSSVSQATHFSDLVPNSAVVTAKTKKSERTRIIREFREGKIQTIFNVGVLTIGFDHPELGCIVLLRPTRSIGLYYQMLGRGVRKTEGKKFCWVIDLTGTVKTLGKVETINLIKRNTWELESEMGSWHKRPLYSFLVKSEEIIVHE